MHEKSADRHHNPARLTTASNHLRGSLRLWRDFTMIGVCSFYPFGVVIWQDVSNMSCNSLQIAIQKYTLFIIQQSNLIFFCIFAVILR